MASFQDPIRKMGLGTRLGAADVYYEVGYDNSGAYELPLNPSIWSYCSDYRFSHV